MIENELKNLGLSEKEAKVYVATLELGSATAQEIAKKSGVNRATAYFVLKQLMALGLVSETEENKKTKFIAEHPERLTVLLKKKEEEIKSSEKLLVDVLPKLQSIYNRSGNKPVIRYYEGIEGPRFMRRDLLKRVKNDSIYCFYNADLVKNIFSDEENKIFRNHKTQQNIKTITIYSAKNPIGDEYDNVERIYIKNKDYKLEADLTLYGDTVEIAKIYRKDKAGVVIIEDKEIANTLRSLFLLAYKGAKEKRASL